MKNKHITSTHLRINILHKRSNTSHWAQQRLNRPHWSKWEAMHLQIQMSHRSIHQKACLILDEFQWDPYEVLYENHLTFIMVFSWIANQKGLQHFAVITVLETCMALRDQGESTWAMPSNANSWPSKKAVGQSHKSSVKWSLRYG